MTDLLARRRHRCYGRDVRRLGLGLLLLLVLSSAWYALRPAVLIALARSSVGCNARTSLLAAAIDRLHPDSRPVRCVSLLDIEYVELVSQRRRTGGFVAWRTDKGIAESPRVTGAASEARQLILADGQFNLIGTMFANYWWADPRPVGDSGAPYGMTLLQFCLCSGARSTTGSSTALDLRYRAVVRIVAQRPEVTGLIVASERGSTRLDFSWTDVDGNGQFELTVGVTTFGQRPDGSRGFISQQQVAIFDLDAQDVPHPRMLPSDGSFLLWTPPDGQPVPVPDDCSLDDFCCSLLPIPDDFGLPATQPATAPTTAPAFDPTPE